MEDSVEVADLAVVDFEVADLAVVVEVDLVVGIEEEDLGVVHHLGEQVPQE